MTRESEQYGSRTFLQWRPKIDEIKTGHVTIGHVKMVRVRPKNKHVTVQK
ncbi:hypothetical protein HanIR_Chr12g0582551 [Helianthus annuus]|nr:hypothetical protein HanIR_Chr12g0582551 [Helianthus annuus]